MNTPVCGVTSSSPPPPSPQSLTVLEYLIKAGSERVTQQCKDNLFSIQTLKDFQFMDKEGKDQGVNGTLSCDCHVTLIIYNVM